MTYCNRKITVFFKFSPLHNPLGSSRSVCNFLHLPRCAQAARNSCDTQLVTQAKGNQFDKPTMIAANRRVKLSSIA